MENAVNQVKSTGATASEALGGVLPGGSAGSKPAILGGGSDFTPGNQVLFDSNFDSVSGGGFLDQWRTNGSGNVARLDSYPGKWLVLGEESSYKLRQLIRYPQRFTVEFDLLLAADKADDIGFTRFGFERDNAVRRYVNGGDGGVELWQSYGSNHIWIESSSTGNKSDRDFDFVNRMNRPIHVAIAVDGPRLNVYMDGVRVAASDLFEPNEAKYFYISGPSNGYDHGAKALMSNVRIAGFTSEKVATHDAP